jgi:hypothetical protein
MVLESFLPLLRAAGSEMDLPFLKAESLFKNFKDLITYAR